MANLITLKQKKNIYQEYLLRLISVVFVVVSILGVFFLAYAIPYYFSVSQNDLRTAEQFEQIINIENKENTGESLSQIVARTEEQLKSVSLYQKQTKIPSASFAEIVKNKNTAISITRLSFVYLDQGQIVVNGLAKNREALVKFISDLKVNPEFTLVESPISDFAKNTNIPFTVNIKIKL
jgi:hypothetical protein